jgi:hypothetical protein
MRITVPKHVVFRPFGNEMVVLNLQTGQYHGLNRTGGRMLEVLAEVGDTHEAARRISAEFDHPVGKVSQDIDELCAALAERSLVDVDGAGGAVAERKPA